MEKHVKQTTERCLEIMIEQIISIVKNASKIMCERPDDISQKGNSSNYVTASDLAVQKFLSQQLTNLIPGSSVVGEEGEGHAANTQYIWVIDPIDGTSNYIRDIGLSVISVGLLKDGQPIAGVIYNPYRDEMFYAQQGQGAFLNGKPIHVSDRDFAHSHLCSAMSLYDKRYAAPCFHIIEKVYHESDDLRRLGSAALELAYMAAGRVELYFEIRLFPWDVAAAITILREAGGEVELLYHETLPLDRPFGLIAANSPESFARLKNIVCEELPTLPY